MVEFFKTVDGRITEVSEFTEGCWVNMVHPSSDELEQIAQAAQVEEEFVRAALDPEESSRVDTEDEQLLMIVDIPMVEKSSVEDGGQMFTTIPMGIVVAQNAVITVCLEDSIILRSIAEGAVKGVHTSLKTRFVFQILLRIAGRFLKNLRMIERDFTRIEKRLYDSLKNEELIQLLGLSKSLVYFSSSLKGNEVTMEKVLRGRVRPRHSGGRADRGPSGHRDGEYLFQHYGGHDGCLCFRCFQQSEYHHEGFDHPDHHHDDSEYRVRLLRYEYR